MTIQYPIIALLAIVAFVATLVMAMYFRQQKRNILSQFAAKEILPLLSQNVSSVKIFAKTILFALGFALLVFALARPQWGYKWEEQKQMGIDIIFAVDTSKSMLAEDIKPNRLERAKLAINDVIERLNGDRIGLIAFSGQAFLQCPITLDYSVFRMSLDALDSNIIQRGGTNIASAIDEADSAFADSKNQKILILISDGEELEQSGISRAEKASKEKGIKIYTLGVGLKNGEPIPIHNEFGKLEFVRDEAGNLVSSKLNEDLLQKVASATGGIYANLSDNGMDEIYEEGLKKTPKAELSAKMKKIAIERFQIPLAIAIIFLVLEFALGTRKFFNRGRTSSGIFVAILACLISANSPSDLLAQEAAPKAPENIVATKKSEPLPEPKTWQEFFNAGIDAVQNKNTEAAKENFYKAIAYSQNDLNIHAKSYYNLGCVDYNIAKALFEKADTNKAIEQAKQAETQTLASLNSSSQVLKKGQDVLKNSGEEALKEQNLQNEIKQAISQCEQAKKTIEETEKTSSEVRENIKKSQAATSIAQKNFENATELAPDMQSAAKNLSSSKNAIKNMSEIDSSLKGASENFASQTKLLDKNIEELKKLLRDDNKDNQDKNNQQNQDNNQENKDNKDQQNQQQNNQQNKDKQNNQQNSQDKKNNQQDQQNSQDKQDKQDAQNQQNKEQNPAQEDKQQEQNKQNSQQEKTSENKKDEQAVNSEQQENSLDKKDEQAAPKPEEEAAKEAEQAQAAQTAKEAETKEDALDYRSQAGVMTRREATQVLDSLKDDEKKLPFSGYGTQRNRFENKKYKDW